MSENKDKEETHRLGHPVVVTPIVATSQGRWHTAGEVLGYVAMATCACGKPIEGRCTTAVSARQSLATEHYWHRTADRASFECIGAVVVAPATRNRRRPGDTESRTKGTRNGVGR